MDFIISFFRDTLDGGLYYVIVVICLILIMAIIGFIMEKAKIAKEESEKTVVIADSKGALVTNQEVVTNTNANAATNISGSVVITDDNSISRPVEEGNFIDFGSTTDNSATSNSVPKESVSSQSQVVDNSLQSVQTVDSAIPQIVAGENVVSSTVASQNQNTNDTGVVNDQVVPEIIDIN